MKATATEAQHIISSRVCTSRNWRRFFAYSLLPPMRLDSIFCAHITFSQHLSTIHSITLPQPPFIIGGLLAVLTAYCLLGGGKRILKITGTVVPFMGVSYVIIALIVILLNYQNVPSMFVLIFKDAFNFNSIFGGIAGSCMVYGIKRGLFSNEAGVGSARTLRLPQTCHTLQSRV